MNTKEMMRFWLWAIFSICSSAIISFVTFAFMAISFSERHNTSTAGDHDFVERDFIITDIVYSLLGVFLFSIIPAFFIFLLQQEACWSLNRTGSKNQGISISGLWLFGLSILILWLGPIVANVSYYLERVPYFR